MPGFDKTGPMGLGAQTGKKMGRCKTGNETSDEISFGRGMRRGFNRRLWIENEKNSDELSGRFFRRRRGGKK